MSSTDTRSILLVNPNTNAATTAMLTALATENLEPFGFSVRGVTAAAGPSMIIDAIALADSAQYVEEAAEAALRDGSVSTAAIVIGAIGDPGRAALAAQVPVPVVGIGQASVIAAAREGRRFGMATSTPELVASLEGLVAEHGASEHFSGVRLTDSEPLPLAADPERQFEELAEAVQRCVELDGAQAVIIAGGPLSETARRIAALGLASIIEPIPSACEFVRQVVAQRR